MDTLFLRQMAYPHEKVPLWGITAAEVEQSFFKGNVPRILLPDFDYTGKPLIAVVLAQDLHPDRSKEDYTVFPDYVDALVAAGGAPVFIVYDYVYEQLRLTRPDGILLIGGNFRLIKKHPNAPYERRPRTYVSMIKYAMQNNLPTFSICGGMQILGVYKGAGVNTGLNDKLDEACSHRQKPYILSHDVCLAPNSLIRKIAGQDKIAVNSCHNTALTDGFRNDVRVTGRAPDGTIEVIEFEHPWSDFVLSVQWHPERLVKIGDENAKKLFAAFIDAANKYHQKTVG